MKPNNQGKKEFYLLNNLLSTTDNFGLTGELIFFIFQLIFFLLEFLQKFKIFRLIDLYFLCLDCFKFIIYHYLKTFCMLIRKNSDYEVLDSNKKK